MKKALSLVLALVMMMSLVTIGANADAASVSIGGDSTTAIGTDKTLTATPTGFTETPTMSYTWTSSDTSVATVSGTAATTTLHPVKPGTTNITVVATNSATSTPEVATSATFAMTVTSAVTGVSLTGDSNLAVGGTGTVTATLTGGVAGETVTFDSSDKAVATVTATAVSTGSGTVTATANVSGLTAGSTNITATCNNKTSSAHAVTVAADSFSISMTRTDLPLIKGTTATRTAQIIDSTASNQAVSSQPTFTYTSSNTSVATVGENSGIVTAVAGKADGTTDTAIITASAKYLGKTYTTNYTVKVRNQYMVSLTPNSSSTGIIPVNNNLYMRAQVQQNIASGTDFTQSQVNNATVNWTLPASSSLTFATNGTALLSDSSTTAASGTAYAYKYVYSMATRNVSGAYVTAAYSGSSAQYKITVQDTITTTASAMNLSVNETGYAAITVTDSAYASYYSIPYYYTTSPSNTYYYRLTGATSSNTTVATAAINATGLLITGKAAGTATITYAVDVYYGATVVGKQTGSFTVTVGGTDIEYYTTYGTNVTFDEIDFQDFFAKATGYTSTYYKPSLSYVQFTNLTNYNTTYNGSLYTKNVGGTVMATNTYAYNNASGNQVDLDAVTFFPGSYTSTSYTVRIPFTAYGYTYSGTTLSNQLTSRSGYVTIKVNATDINLAMTLNNTTATTLASINSSLVSAIAAKKNINAANVTVNSVTFGAQQDNFGTLYANSSRVALGTSAYLYNVNGTAVNTNAYSNYFHNLYFVPTATTTGGYYQVPFTASTNQGAVTGLLTIKVPATGKTFLDVPTTHTFYKYIQYVADKGIMNGSGSYFNPGKSLTRAQLVVTLYRLAGSPTTYNYQTLNFKDANQIATTEFANAIRWAVANDIIGGYADNTFRPNSAITRQAMVTILYRYAEATNGGTYYSGNQIAGFKDASRVAKNMTAAMNWAVYNGYITGNGSYLNPTGTTTRGAAAKILAIFNGYTA